MMWDSKTCISTFSAKLYSISLKCLNAKLPIFFFIGWIFKILCFALKLWNRFLLVPPTISQYIFAWIFKIISIISNLPKSPWPLFQHAQLFWLYSTFEIMICISQQIRAQITSWLLTFVLHYGKAQSVTFRERRGRAHWKAMLGLIREFALRLIYAT